jgi:hypothetical protein
MLTTVFPSSRSRSASAASASRLSSPSLRYWQGPCGLAATGQGEGCGVGETTGQLQMTDAEKPMPE